MPTPDLSPAALAEAKRVCEAATPGPWDHSTIDADGLKCSKLSRRRRDGSTDRIASCAELADGTFIAQARTLLPALIDEVEEHREREAKVREILEARYGSWDQRYDAIAALFPPEGNGGK